MSTPLDRKDVERFRVEIAHRLGVQVDDGRLDDLAEKLRLRIEASGSGGFPAYLAHLTSPLRGREEIRALAEHLTVGETYFFRNTDHFRVFTEVVLPERAKAGAGRRRLRIASLGCSSGEEPYSLAMVLRDRLPDVGSWTISIRAVDINASMIEKAAVGRYSSWSLRETPPELRDRHFRIEGRDFTLDPRVREMVSFEERNLAEDDPVFFEAESFDVVFCRNLLMYFSTEAARSLVARIARSLVPMGFLFLGHAETLRGLSQDFHLRHTHETFYYQRRERGTHGSTPPRSRESAFPPSSSPAMSIGLDGADSWVEAIQQASERIAALARGAAYSAPQEGEPPPEPIAHPVAVAHPIADVAHGPAGGLERAHELLGEERFAEAMEILGGLPPGSREDVDAEILRAVILTNKGNLAEAETVCERLLQLDELNAGAHYLMALCCEHRGDPAKAIEHDRAAVYLDPTFAMPHLHLGFIAKRAIDPETAKHELESAVVLLSREEASRILLFGGGFNRDALIRLCRAELRITGGHR